MHHLALAHPIAAPLVPPQDGDVSGPAWVLRYPDSKSLGALKGAFQINATRFIAALRHAGAVVTINTTFRPEERAYLMHYSTSIALGKISPDKVPAGPHKSPVPIRWVHTNAQGMPDMIASVKAAAAMKQAYGIAYPPALHSRHTQHLAIDMTITWARDIFVYDRDYKRHWLYGPGIGSNCQRLHAIGETYHVYKLLKDPPHWSVDGH
jgi:hypothetical protein